MKFIIHSGYSGFVTSEKKNGSFEFGQSMHESRLFSEDEINSIHSDLTLDHPLSEWSIIEVREFTFSSLETKALTQFVIDVYAVRRQADDQTREQLDSALSDFICCLSLTQEFGRPKIQPALNIKRFKWKFLENVYCYFQGMQKGIRTSASKVSEFIFTELEVSVLAHLVNEVNSIQSEADGFVREMLDRVMNRLPSAVSQKLFAYSSDKIFDDWVMVNGRPVLLD